ncbi:MAG: DHHA1 domain-containing protein [Pyrinomonadaceae bacterium]|nr:DHHA1 domain-containing protein [Pyrinomonadaceae bacterium]
MPPTERLYYQDSHLIEFEARVIANSERVSGWTAVTLDRTAFYPTGGGQPSDTGTLNGLRVVECIDDEADVVLHVIQGRAPEVGTIVKGRIDWLRRLDHMQQHTGQHIFSQAFVKLFNAPTRSFRVLDEACEIDVDLDNPTSETIERAVELANNVIWENRAITISQVSSQEASGLPLRKESARAGDLRLIEIEGFDLTPCGGTHAYQTGEVGMIAVRSWERAKGLARIEFVAGLRALADYRRANQSARAVAGVFSAALSDTPELASRMIEENKQLHRRVRALEEIAARVEAEELLAQAATTPDNVRIVNKVFDNRDSESLKQLALSLIAHPATIALLGSRDKDAARLVFARSVDVPGDMNVLIRDACVMLDGRGGGKPDLAQGGGKNLDKLSEAIEMAAKRL